MYCSNCGTKNPDGAKFCKACGTPLASASSMGASKQTGTSTNAVSNVTTPQEVQVGTVLPGNISIPETHKDITYNLHFTKLFPMATTEITVSDTFLSGSFPRSGLLGVLNDLSEDRTIAIEKIDGVKIGKHGNLGRTIAVTIGLIFSAGGAMEVLGNLFSGGGLINLLYAALLVVLSWVFIVSILSYNTYCLVISAAGSLLQIEVPKNGLAELVHIHDDLKVRIRNSSQRVVSQQSAVYGAVQNARIADDSTRKIVDAINDLNH